MDKPQYVLGTAFTATGKVLDYNHKDPRLNNVSFTIFDPSGKPIMNTASSSGFTAGKETSKINLHCNS